MRQDQSPTPGTENLSYAQIFREIGTSTKDLVQSEVALIKAEIKETAQNTGSYFTQATIFGALLAISVFPFLAFLVIGLGQLMGDRYWLSSLLVAIVCAVVGGAMAYRAYKRIRDGVTFARTRSSLSTEKQTVSDKMSDVKEAFKGESYGAHNLH